MRNLRPAWPFALAASILAASASSGARAAEPLTDERKIERAKAYAARIAANDHAGASALLAPDARTWYEKREGEGEPLKPGSGRWGHWDAYFHGKTTLSEWRVENGAVVATANETNDFYRLLDWTPWPMRFTYWLDAQGRISGFMVQAVPGKGPAPNRFKEAVAWGKAKHPEEIAYLMPKEHLDPTGDRAERWEKLLIEWRKAAGLPEVAIEKR